MTFALTRPEWPAAEGRVLSEGLGLTAATGRVWKSRALRLKVLGDEDEGAGRGHGAGEEVA